MEIIHHTGINPLADPMICLQACIERDQAGAFVLDQPPESNHAFDYLPG
jgi:hypothetical protein